MTDLTLTETDDSIRTIRVTTWLSLREAEVIDLKRGHYNRASYLRAAGLEKEIAHAPDPVAREQWADLGRLRGDVNQIAHHLNLAAHMDGANRGAREAMDNIVEINMTLDKLRAWLVAAVESTVKAA